VRREENALQARRARGGSKTKTQPKTTRPKKTPKKKTPKKTIPQKTPKKTTPEKTPKKETPKKTKDNCKAGSKTTKVGKGVWMFPILDTGVWKRKYLTILSSITSLLVAQPASFLRSTTSSWTANSTTSKPQRESPGQRKSIRSAPKTTRNSRREARPRARPSNLEYSLLINRPGVEIICYLDMYLYR
jgi:hypothetical protein